MAWLFRFENVVTMGGGGGGGGGGAGLDMKRSTRRCVGSRHSLGHRTDRRCGEPRPLVRQSPSVQLLGARTVPWRLSSLTDSFTVHRSRQATRGACDFHEKGNIFDFCRDAALCGRFGQRATFHKLQRVAGREKIRCGWGANNRQSAPACPRGLRLAREGIQHGTSFSCAGPPQVLHLGLGSEEHFAAAMGRRTLT